jgi:hypothetical protein
VILQNKDRHNRPDVVEPYVVRLVAHAIVGCEQPPIFSASCLQPIETFLLSALRKALESPE